MKTNQRSSFSRRMILGGGKAAVAIGALAGAASWASKGYPPASASAMVASASRPVADEPMTTGSIAPRAPLPAAAKPGVEPAQARTPDFDQRSLALLAAGTTAEGAPTRSPAKPAPVKTAAAKPASKPEAAKPEPAKVAAKPAPAKPASAAGKPAPDKTASAKPATTKVQ